MQKTHARGVARREDILGYIAAYQHENGFAPSIRNIASALGYRTTSVVHHHLKVLAEEDKIDLCPGTARAIRLK